jgi:hypothetical protein
LFCPWHFIDLEVSNFEFRICICCCFLQADTVEKIQNLLFSTGRRSWKKSKFWMFESMSYQGHFVQST